MGSSKPSDTSSAKSGETPKSAVKKANEKASSADARLPETAVDASPTDDTILDSTPYDTEGYFDELDVVKEPLLENATKKSASKSLEKKPRSKSATKPTSKATSKRKPTLASEPALPSKDSAFSGSGATLESGAENESVDGFVQPAVSSKPARNFAPSLSLSQSYQSVNQSSDRIAIFIDGSNLFYAASHLNIEVDYRRLLSSLVRGRRLLRAYFYTGVDPQNEKQRGFLLWLNRHGHRVVSKELTHLPDGSRKANMHVEMAVDMMRISEYCPNITLLGGDGNLAYALEVLSQRGTFIEVVSLQSMTSDSLIDLADSYTDLADLRDDIKR